MHKNQPAIIPKQRKIIHIDMDAFFAAVEERDDPSLVGKPVAVGGSSGRGVVMTANYEARKFGVHSAMPSSIAQRKCPNLIFVKSRMEAYKQASQIIRAIFHRYTDLIEPLSLDEAYLDVTHDKQDIGSATRIAENIRQNIFEETQLTASAGISYNKFLAKIASDMNKPNGQTLILPEQALDFLAQLPVEKFHGVGKVTAQKMHGLNIKTGGDLRSYSLSELINLFGKSGSYYYNVVRGTDDRPVRANRIRKSIGAETTFTNDKTSYEELYAEMEEIARSVENRAKNANMLGYCLTLKIKFFNFEIKTKRTTVQTALFRFSDIIPLAAQLLKTIELNGKKVRLIGLSLSNLEPKNDDENGAQQTFLF